MVEENSFSTFNENITLHELLTMYYDNFAGKTYHYHMLHTDTSAEITFEVGHMKSLLGIHHFGYTGKQNQAEKMIYDMLNNEATFEMLKKKNPQMYKKKLKQIQYLQFLPDLMKNGSFGISTLSSPQNNIDFFIFTCVQERNIYLGIKKEKHSDIYHPVTFIIDKKNHFHHIDFIHPNGMPFLIELVGTSYRVY